jgi:hypothetical protein
VKLLIIHTEEEEEMHTKIDIQIALLIKETKNMQIDTN